MAKDFRKEREKMINAQLKMRGISDKKVLETMKKEPRHEFVSENMKPYAYNDEPLPIGEGQTISQPYIVAYMTEILHLEGDEKVLEIGTGSGYQAAILAEIVKEVYTVEIKSSLSLRAKEILKKLEYKNVHFKIGDGSLGWKEHAPYDAIIVTAAPTLIPNTLQEQLKIKGKMIIPVGDISQELILVIREEEQFKKKKLLPVRFVPLISTH